MTKNQKTKSEPSSFRDPSGCVYYRNNNDFRQVNRSYKKDFDFLFSSGLYEALVQQRNLLSHTRLARNHSASKNATIIWGTGVEKSLEEQISVTIIATGFKTNSIPELYIRKKN